MGSIGRRAYLQKQHTCKRCGCEFRYAIDPTDWKTPLMSQTFKPEGSVRCHPCPDCGLYQPEMVMWLKSAIPFSWVAAMLLLVILAAVGMASGGRNAVVASQIGVGVFAIFALVQVGTAMSNPNSDLAGNRAQAKDEIRAGELELVTEGDEKPTKRPTRDFGVLHLPGMLAVLAGPAGFVYTILLLSDRPEPPTNDHCSPSIVMPGDKVQLTCSSCNAECLDGMWRGTPTVRVMNARSLGLPETLTAEGSNLVWGDSFTVRKGAGNGRLKPKISFTLPKSEKLVNQTVRLAITMQITYPYKTTRGFQFDHHNFVDQTATIREDVMLKVADNVAVKENQTAYAFGLAGGGVALFGGLWLTGITWALVLRGSKSEIVSLPPTTSREEPFSSRCEPAANSPPRQARDGYDLIGMGNNLPPVIDDFDRSKWGDRHLR